MKPAFPGLHKVSRRLLGGGQHVHYYAWRGGPKINAAFGTLEFAQEFATLTAGRDVPRHHANTLQHLINQYQSTPAFQTLAPETRAGYIRRIRRIESEFGSLPLGAVNDPRIRGDFLAWRDTLAEKGHLREADYTFAVLALIMAWAYDRRLIKANPCERPGRLCSGGRADIVWQDDQIAALLAVASPAVALPVQIARFTGQRQGDILALTWAAYDGAALRLRQSKRGRHMVIPVASPLRAILDAAKAQRGAAVTICATTRGTPWTKDGFKTSFGKAKDAAGLAGVTFHDFRGTAVVQLARAGCSVPEICQITGHALKDAESILDRHYLARDRALAESAISKLEKHLSGTPPVNAPVNGPARPALKPV